jgi:regulator of replication initiation timing
MPNSHNLVESHSADERQIKEFIDRFVEENLIFKVEVKMLSVRVLRQELVEESVDK